MPDELKEIIILKADTQEVLAIIPNKKKDIIQAKDITIICNYGKERETLCKNGKIYLKDDE